MLHFLSAHTARARAYKVSEHEYRRYVVPQIRNIIQDYYTFIKVMHGEYEGRAELYSIPQTLPKHVSDLLQHCRKDYLENLCHENIGQFNQKILKWEKAKNMFLARYNCMKSFPDLCLSFLRFNQILEKQFRRLQDEITNGIIKSANSKSVVFSIAKMAEKLSLLSNLWLAESVIFPFQAETHQVWASFIHPLQQWSWQKSGRKFLKIRHMDLDRSWNDFSIRLQKREGSAPAKGKVLVSIMANRWNAIMKVALR